MATGVLRGEPLLIELQRDFIGLDTCYRVADGGIRRRVYLDSAATTLLLRFAHDTATELLRHHANTHSRVHFSAGVATEAYAHARARVLSFLGADPDRYVCLFVGSGATGALNRAASYLRAYRPHARTVLVSLMEHHSNDLPHRRQSRVCHVPLVGEAPALGPVDVDAFGALLRAEPVQYAAVSMVSNVTGIINPIALLAAAARAEGVPLVVDASQAIAHLPVRMEALGAPDVLVFSGHKVYAPASPGILIVRRDIVEAAEPAELGGGMVREVSQKHYVLAPELADREEAGTPNVIGAVTLSAVLEVLERIGMQALADHKQALTELLVEELLCVPELRLYGPTPAAPAPRVGVACFNIGALDHGLVAAVLNDYFCIAVRNGCFCAHPYVQALLAPELWDLDVPEDPREAEREVRRRRGMVRASLAMYSSPDDIRLLGSALREIQANARQYRELYHVDDQGEYHHGSFRAEAGFEVPGTVDRLLSLRCAEALPVACRGANPR
jgi:cysteine desulfurase / selenocysteine lyase